MEVVQPENVTVNGDGVTEERPTTPSMPISIIDKMTKSDDEWWRPSHPPETYKWEEVRRQRKKGGYPWTLLDNEDDEIDASEYLDDNLYEPVNPPPLHESGSAAIHNDKVETGSLDGYGYRHRVDIPPEIEIVNSEGLDGLDQPDRHDFGIDGDREWVHSEDEQTVPSKILFTAGIRGQEHTKDSESHGSHLRPMGNKTITFDPTTKDGNSDEFETHHEVPQNPSRSRSRSRSPNPRDGGPPKKTTTAFEILKNKAAGAAGQVKQRFNKISLPVRPKLSQSEGGKLSRKKPKKKSANAGTSSIEQEQEVPQDDDMVQSGEADVPRDLEEPMEVSVPQTEQFTGDEQPTSSKDAQILRNEKEAAAEEKRKKQAEQEELKKQKAEEKKREVEEKKREADEKKREAEELKRQKLEEKQRAKEEADRKKVEEKAAKVKAQEEAKKIKLEEQLAKARELEEQERQKNEETLRLREEEAAATYLTHEDDIQEIDNPEQKVQPEPTTPTGTGSRRKKIKKTFVQLPKLPDLPQLPHIDLDFKRKVIKRSKTPPARPTNPKVKQRKGVEDNENQLASQYAAEIEARKLELEEEIAQEPPPPVRAVKFPETPIFVTQPSTENSEETESHRDWKSFPSTSSRNEDDNDEPLQTNPQGKQQVGAKERLDKFGQSLKGFGMKSKEMASKKSKAMGATMKVIGKDLQKFGVKTSEKFQATIEEIKLKQEAAKARSKEKAKEAEDIDLEMPMDVTPYPQESATEPRRKFRFRRRDDSQDEHDEGTNKGVERYETREEQDHGKSPDSYNQQEEGGEKITRSQLLGRAERDWESPLELARSREASEEPFSGNASSRDSPPGSSLASSTFAHVRKQGVLEEIDSDEFFLREKGISEGEDEEEINRFLVEELRQAFRLQENALAGFDLQEPPQRPGRQPRKPPRKEKEEPQQSYQTFPPERPRRKAPGYISDYIKEHGNEMEEEEEDQASNREERGSYLEDIDEFAGDGAQFTKQELHKSDRHVNEKEFTNTNKQEFVDDGRYEPVSDEPVKPIRRKKQKDSAPLYYNTVGGANDWMREIEDQVLHHPNTLSAPRHVEMERSKSRSLPPETDDNDITFVDQGSRDESKLSLPTQEPRNNQVDGRDREVDLDDDMEYVDEAGYAVVHKDREPPRTTPRRKKRSGGSKGSSLKRDQQAPSASGDASFFSLPRFTPRSIHVVPPSRPQRTQYSTLRPRRPPRHRSNQSLTKAKGDKTDAGRPSSSIGIMQGRPLPAIPSPRSGRSPHRMNDLDQTSIERAVGARHYANFISEGGPREVEEVCVATNIPLLGRTGDINIAIQTDPVQEYESESGVVIEDATRRGQRQSDPQSTTTNLDGLRQDTGRAHSMGRDRDESQHPGSQFMFPRRLHLDELEVDVLRVHDLTAHSINVEHMRTSQMEVNSLTSIGPLTVSSIHTQTLNSDQINCNRLASDTVDLPIPTIVPPAFYNLASSDPTKEHCDEKPEELRLLAAKEEQEDIACPYTPFDENEDKFENTDSLKADLSFERPTAGSPADDFFMCGRSLEFCLTPEQSVDNDDSWGLSERGNKTPVDREFEQTAEKISPSHLDDDLAHISDLQLDSAEQSTEVRSLPTDGLENMNIPLQEQRGDRNDEIRDRANLSHAFRIAVLENDSSEDKSEDLDLPEVPQNEAPPILSGSLRLEYRRSPEVPSNFQVLHEMHVEREADARKTPTPQISQSSPPLVRFNTKLVNKPESIDRKSASTDRSTTPSEFGRSSLSSSREPSENKAGGIAEISPQSITKDEPEEGIQQQQQDLVQLSLRFGRALYRIVIRGLQAVIEYVDVATTDDPTKAEEQRAHMQVLLCVLLILIAGVILSSNSSVVSFSPPKWEFLMPPPHL